MRTYGKLLPAFWTGSTGKALRGDLEAQVLAIYFVSCPSANMVGLYYLPWPTILHETGLTAEGASKALRRVESEGFAFYDPDSEVVWVPEMARIQIGAGMKASDNRAKFVVDLVDQYKNSKFFGNFVERYWDSFSLPMPRPEARPFEAPSKALRSQKQYQKQYQDQEQDAGADAPERVAAPPPAREGQALLTVQDAAPQKPTKRKREKRSMQPYPVPYTRGVTAQFDHQPSEAELWWAWASLRRVDSPLCRGDADPGMHPGRLNQLHAQHVALHGREWLSKAWIAWCEGGDEPYASSRNPSLCLQAFFTAAKVAQLVSVAKQSTWGPGKLDAEDYELLALPPARESA